MDDPNRSATARWLPILIVGMSLNTIGIVLRGAGVFRWVLVGAGILLMLAALVGMLSANRR